MGPFRFGGRLSTAVAPGAGSAHQFGIGGVLWQAFGYASPERRPSLPQRSHNGTLTPLGGSRCHFATGRVRVFSWFCRL